MKCFVIMPFGDAEKDAQEARIFDRVYHQWVKPAVESVPIPGRPGENIACSRADKELRPGEIITDIIRNLVDADIVIADLSGRNANVFYELGVRHAVNNNTILVAQDVADIPFDLKGLRTIAYTYDPEHMLSFKTTLQHAIQELLAGPQRADNPVRRFLLERELDALESRPAPPGYDFTQSLAQEIAALRTDFRRESARLLDALTAPREELTPGTHAPQIDLQFFEGIWHEYPTQSTCCARVVAGELLVPYSFAGNSQLTGHFHDCRLARGSLFARFDWFRRPISGYASYRPVTRDELAGGWWYGDQARAEIVRIDPRRLTAESSSGMVESMLVRVADTTQFPEWARAYFTGTEAG